jgi:hypothetical protein
MDNLPHHGPQDKAPGQVNLYTGDVETAQCGRADCPSCTPRPYVFVSRRQRRDEYWALYARVEARILARCAERGWTEADLEAAANCRISVGYQRGVFCYNFKLSQLSRIAKALGVDVADLFAEGA